MLFFGWGKGSRQKQLSDASVLLTVYSYFNLAFFFIASGYTYKIASPVEGGWTYRDITKEEATRLANGRLPMPNIWFRYSLIPFLLLIALVAIFSPN